MAHRTPATDEELRFLFNTVTAFMMGASVEAQSHSPEHSSGEMGQSLHLSAEEEKRECCRKIIWERLLRVPYDDCRNHRFFMQLLLEDLHKIKIEGRWEFYGYMWTIMDDLVIVAETYTMENGYVEMQGITKYTYRNDHSIYHSPFSLIKESIVTYTATNDDAGAKIKQFNGTIVTRSIWSDNICQDKTPSRKMEVEMREFEDRIEERITPLHRISQPDYVLPIVIKKVTYKHDLFRSEIFRPIHDELLYSLDLQMKFKTFTNEATRAKEHYESLQQ